MHRWNFSFYATRFGAVKAACYDYLSTDLDNAMTEDDEALATEIMCNWGLPDDTEIEDVLNAVAAIREDYEAKQSA